jgi:micrococcal nuclease
MTHAPSGLVALAMLAIGSALADAIVLAQPPPRTAAPVALVERVVDGDTVVIRLDGQSVKVRLIGVDAPESVDPRKPVERFAHESAAFLRSLVEGKTVRLAYEPAGARMDEYGRVLVYLYKGCRGDDLGDDRFAENPFGQVIGLLGGRSGRLEQRLALVS